MSERDHESTAQVRFSSEHIDRDIDPSYRNRLERREARHSQLFQEIGDSRSDFFEWQELPRLMGMQIGPKFAGFRIPENRSAQERFPLPE
jgi:hypothetical protein